MAKHAPFVPPAPSVVHLSRPVSEDRLYLRRRPARVTRSPTPSMSKTESGVDYFFFRAVFFAGFFALAFAFLFFAIAALLA